VRYSRREWLLPSLGFDEPLLTQVIAFKQLAENHPDAELEIAALFNILEQCSSLVAINEGALKAKKIGKSRWIKRSDLDEYVAGLV
jgi:hypothetical protein